MNAFEKMLACAGTWEGINRVKTAAAEPSDESTSRVIVTPVLRDTFIHFDHTWSWKGEPQIGAMLIGYSPNSGAASIHWIDTWHNGRRVMPLVGAFNEDGILVANGSFPVKDGPDWGWRIEIEVNDGGLRIEMFCLDPGGKRDGGVLGNFRRV